MRDRKLVGLVLGLALVTGLPAAVDGQSRFTFEGGGGVSIPVGPLNDMASVGSSLSGSIGYRLIPRLAFRLDFAANFLEGINSSENGIAGPDLNLYQYTGGFEFEFTDPRHSKWHVILNAGAGATTFDTDEFTLNGVDQDFTESYFTTNAGLGIGYEVSSDVDLFFKIQWYVAFTDEEDTAIFSEINPLIDPEGFETASVIPVTLGFRIKIN